MMSHLFELFMLEGGPEEEVTTDSVDEQARLAKKESKRARKKARKALAENQTEGDAQGE